MPAKWGPSIIVVVSPGLSKPKVGQPDFLELDEYFAQLAYWELVGFGRTGLIVQLV